MNNRVRSTVKGCLDFMCIRFVIAKSLLGLCFLYATLSRADAPDFVYQVTALSENGFIISGELNPSSWAQTDSGISMYGREWETTVNGSTTPNEFYLFTRSRQFGTPTMPNLLEIHPQQTVKIYKRGRASTKVTMTVEYTLMENSGGVASYGYTNL